MDVDERELPLKDEVHQIVGCSMEVLNVLGHGLLEKPYENALTVEFGLRGIPFRQQVPYDIWYKGTKVGRYIADLVCFDEIVVDTKTIEAITNHELGQMLNYLKLAKMQVGLIINFKFAKLQWRRVVRTRDTGESIKQSD